MAHIASGHGAGGLEFFPFCFHKISTNSAKFHCRLTAAAPAATRCPLNYANYNNLLEATGRRRDRSGLALRNARYSILRFRYSTGTQTHQITDEVEIRIPYSVFSIPYSRLFF